MTDSQPGTRRALLISISDYPYPHWKLDGCANDLALMYRALTGQFGFQKKHITLLRDAEATREGILTALEDLVTSTQRDDIVVVHYAGHGSQMTCREGDEPDGLDETLVPYDSGRGDDENRDITDDELHVFLGRLGEKTRFTTLIFDCCHSGTITRDGFGGKTRAVTPDLRSPDDLPPSPIGSDPAGPAAGNPGPSGWLSLSDKYVLIAGCAEEEQSAEKRVGEDAYGALTWYLSQELMKAGPGTTYRDVFEGMTCRVTANCARQHPQMEGMLDRELFGVRDIEPGRYVLVTGREGGSVTLAAGAAHGLTAGSRWEIVPGGTGEVNDETRRLGEVEIAAVEPVESQARFVGGEGRDEIEGGCRAIETAHAHGDSRLGCQVVAPVDSDVAEQIRARLAASPLLTEAEESASVSDVRIYVLDARPDPTNDNDPAQAAGRPIPQLRNVDGTTLAAVGEQGELVVPVERVGARTSLDGDVEALIDNLESLARFRQSLAIRNPSHTSALRDTVSLELLQEGPNGTLVPAETAPAGGHIVFEEGELFTLEIKNNGSEEVYFNLLDFDPAGTVSLVFPVQGANDKLAPGASLPLRLRPSLPEKMPEASLGRPDGAIEGTETFKLFVTTQPADFSFLQDGGFRGTEPEPVGGASPLELLMRTATGLTTRGVDLVVPATEDDWTTVERTFVIRRSPPEGASPG